MAHPNQIQPVIFATLVGLFLNSGVENAVSQPRTIFNQSPETIERYFGRYWTRLTTKDSKGNTIIAYTYNPAKFQRIFPESAGVQFTIIFENQRARSIEISHGRNLMQNYLDRMNQVFITLFGDAPNSKHPVYKKVVADTREQGGTLHYTQYCITDRIGAGHEWVSTQELTLVGRFMLDDRCKE